MGRIGGLEASTPSDTASSAIATAKSYQLATPESHQWYSPETRRRLKAHKTRARPVTLVGAPIWSLTTVKWGRLLMRRSMVVTKLRPSAEYSHEVRITVLCEGSSRITASSPCSFVLP